MSAFILRSHDSRSAVLFLQKTNMQHTGIQYRLRISQKQRQMSSLLVGGRYCRNRDIAQGDMKKIMGDMKKIMGVLSKTFLQFILAAKSLVQHSSIRPDPVATTLAFSSVRLGHKSRDSVSLGLLVHVHWFSIDSPSL